MSRLDHLLRKDAERLRLVSELHYAVKPLSDEAMRYLLRVAASLAIEEQTPSEHLAGQTRVVITGPETAEVAVVWAYRSEVFLSSRYKRHENGGWTSDTGMVSPRWCVELEQRYQQKLAEVRQAALSEAVGHGH